MSVVEDIKDRIDIVELVSETVKLRRTGKNYIGFCPFHANTHTPAFVVFPESGTWRCFGQCAEGGDVFTYMMKRESCDFQQALELLAKRAGVELSPQNRDDRPIQEKQLLFQMMEEAVAYFQNNLLETPAGRPAWDFLHKRGLKDETIRQFHLGYSFQSWDALTQHLLAKGYSRQNLVDGGLVSEQRDDKGDVIPNGRFYDRFRNRVMIPIRDSKGNTIGFGARILNPNDSPKFLNSPQTVLFDKGKTLFALDHARRSIREMDQVVLVEGYMDVIVLHQEGFSNTVSPMGTALTDFQAKQLTRQTRNIVLALDGDPAGDHGAVRGIDVLRSVLRPAAESSDGKAMMQAQSRLNANIRVTKIPSGMDPDEVVLRDKEEWQAILQSAKPLVVHMMETVAAGRDLEDAKVKAEIAEEIMPLIQEIPNVIEREAYRQQLARLIRIDESFLRFSDPGNLNGTRRSARQLPERPRPRQNLSVPIFDSKGSIQNKEIEILKILYRCFDSPGALSGIDRILRAYGLEPLSPDDFERPDLHEIASCYFDALDQDEEPNTRAYMDAAISPSVRETLKSLSIVNEQLPSDLREIYSEITRLLACMRKEKGDYLNKQLQEMLMDPGEADDVSLAQFEEKIKKSNDERRYLDQLIEGLTHPDLQR